MFFIILAGIGVGYDFWAAERVVGGSLISTGNVNSVLVQIIAVYRES